MKKTNKFKGFHTQFISGNTLYMIFCVKYCVVFWRSFCVEYCVVFCVNWKIPILSYKLQIFRITFYFQSNKEGPFLRGTASLLIYQNSRKFPPCSFILTCSFIKLKKNHPARLFQPAHLLVFKEISSLLIYFGLLVY